MKEVRIVLGILLVLCMVLTPALAGRSQGINDDNDDDAPCCESENDPEGCVGECDSKPPVITGQGDHDAYCVFPEYGSGPGYAFPEMTELVGCQVDELVQDLIDTGQDGDYNVTTVYGPNPGGPPMPVGYEIVPVGRNTAEVDNLCAVDNDSDISGWILELESFTNQARFGKFIDDATGSGDITVKLNNDLITVTASAGDTAAEMTQDVADAIDAHPQYYTIWTPNHIIVRSWLLGGIDYFKLHYSKDVGLVRAAVSLEPPNTVDEVYCLAGGGS